MTDLININISDFYKHFVTYQSDMFVTFAMFYMIILSNNIRGIFTCRQTTFFENNSIIFFIIICSWIFVPLWIINSFNFIDGINGLAIGTAIFSATALILSLYISKGSSNFITIYSIRHSSLWRNKLYRNSQR